MSARAVPGAPGAAGRESVTFTVDGRSCTATAGTTIAAALLAADRTDWRRTSVAGAPRGVFCGIGVCFDCIVTVNGLRDVRACLRRVTDGDEVRTQHDALPQVHR